MAKATYLISFALQRALELQDLDALLFSHSKELVRFAFQLRVQPRVLVLKKLLLLLHPFLPMLQDDQHEAYSTQ